MIVFWKNSIKKGSLHDLVVHLIPAILVVSLFEIIAIEVYLNTPLQESKIKFFVWRSAQAIGGFILGYLSDKYCRKKILILTQVLGALILPLLLWQNFAIFPLFLIGFFFNPSPIARAALIDNFPKESKAKLIAITYVAQFIPWCFYLKVKGFTSYEVIMAALITLAINVTISYLFFEDRKDKKSNHKKETSQSVVHTKRRKRALYTLCALFSGQLVFFISDTFFENLTSNAGLFSALGIGSLIGVIVGIFYRKIPHLSLLTFCFGIGILLSVVPLITNYLVPDLNIDLPYQLMLFSNLGGFYLPFVFDVVLSATSASYRGTACGIIDLIIALSSIIGVAIVILLSPTETLILSMTIILFLISTVIQKKGEKHV